MKKFMFENFILFGVCVEVLRFEFILKIYIKNWDSNFIVGQSSELRKIKKVFV